VFPIAQSGEVGALLGFRPQSADEPTTILARVGVSFISEEQACTNAEAEIPDFDFARVVNAARSEWDELLGRVQVVVAEGQEDTRKLLYSSVSAACICDKIWPTCL
jgi:putative alpha-1,2-mannosidase